VAVEKYRDQGVAVGAEGPRFDDRLRMRLLGGLLALGVLACALPLAARSRSVWDGVYSKDQSERGRKVYDETCARCHGETLLGGDDAKPLVGDAFFERWDGKPVFELFDITRRKMPDDGPAVLSRRETADVVAYLLSANAFPAAEAELASEDEPLKDILITKVR
jgi:mono/diheme cytochrome c family protein